MKKYSFRFKFNKKMPKAHTQLIAFGLCLLLCANVLSATTYAWFTDSIFSKVGTTSSATYDVVVTNAAGESLQSPYVLESAPNDLHTFSLTATGNASKGYCVVTITAENAQEGQDYYIFPIDAGQVVSFQLQAAANTTVAFRSSWGEAPEGVQVLTPSMSDAESLIVSLEFSQTPSTESEIEESETTESETTESETTESETTESETTESETTESETTESETTESETTESETTESETTESETTESETTESETTESETTESETTESETTESETT